MQCSPEVPAAGVFAGYSCLKCRLLQLLDQITRNFQLVFSSVLNLFRLSHNHFERMIRQFVYMYKALVTLASKRSFVLQFICTLLPFLLFPQCFYVRQFICQTASFHTVLVFSSIILVTALVFFSRRFSKVSLHVSSFALH